MSKKRRGSGNHTLDTAEWSATRTAKRAASLRDDIVSKMNGNIAIMSIFVAEIKDLHDKYTEVYIKSGYGDVAARNMASSDLWMRRYERPDTDAALAGVRLGTRSEYEAMAMARIDHHVETVNAAELFMATPTMHATIMAAVNTLDVEDLRRWTPEDVISEDGMLLFPSIQPFYLSDDALMAEEIIAITWSTMQSTKTDDNGDVVPETLLYATAWFDCDGPAESKDFNEIRGMAENVGCPLPGIMPVANAALRMDFQDGVVANPEIDQKIRNVTLPRAEDVVPGEYSGEAIRGESLMDWTLKYLMAFMRLSSQKTAVSEPFSQGIDGNSKRKPYHNVRVVRLGSRQRDGQDSSPAYSTRNYTGRWIVRMHKVNQWYPSTKTHKVIWRGPFIKGPDDAPLIAVEKVNLLG